MIQVHHTPFWLIQRGRPNKEIFSDLDLRGAELLADPVSLGPCEDIASFYKNDLTLCDRNHRK